MAKSNSDSPLKFVIVGNRTVGKTSLIKSYTTASFPTTHIPEVTDNVLSYIKRNGIEIYHMLWDTAGQDDYIKIRPLSYPNTDVFFICFSIIDPISFEYRFKWIREIKYYCPDTPFIYVGTKLDLKTDNYTLQELYKQNIIPLTTEQMKQAAKEDGAQSFIECSAKTLENLCKVFEEGINIYYPKQTNNSILSRVKKIVRI